MLLKGKLDNYFATGEPARPQFVGEKSTDEKGRIVNYNYIYDIKDGDEITLIAPFLNETIVKVSSTTYAFLFILSMISTNPVEARFKPGKGNKSWGKIMKEYKKGAGRTR